MRPLLEGLGPAPHIVVLGAHSDDIEIGCGGTVLELAHRYPDASVDWVVFSGVGERAAEARASAADFCAGLDLHVDVGAFPENLSRARPTSRPTSRPCGAAGCPTSCSRTGTTTPTRTTAPSAS